jgi:hypothetical protein
MAEELRTESEKTTGQRSNMRWWTGHAWIPDQASFGHPNNDEVFNKSHKIEESYHQYHKLLRMYLYKRRPIHLRRTLDQYYYSHVANTNLLDENQLVMRNLNEAMKGLKLKCDPKYRKLMGIKARAEVSSNATAWERTFAKLSGSTRKTLAEVEDELLKLRQAPYRNVNKPILMVVDQLWVWVIDDSLF